MTLGNFSISLAVKDIQKSKEFYEKVGFEVFHGDPTDNWMIMKNQDLTIGLFQGMFDGNIMTFNPGWDENANTLESFSDVRELHKKFKANGIDIVSETIEKDSGPGSFSIIDPDGNTILFDQHV